MLKEIQALQAAKVHADEAAVELRRKLTDLQFVSMSRNVDVESTTSGGGGSGGNRNTNN
jgi:hypothetical protein